MEVTEEAFGPPEDCLVAVDWAPEKGEGSDEMEPVLVWRSAAELDMFVLREA